MKKKIKILQVIGSLRIGGAENVAMNICRYLDKKKFQCDFLVFSNTIGDYEPEAIELGSNIIRIPLPNDNYKNYYNNLKKVLREGEYDIVHSHVLLNNGLVMKAAYDVNVKKRISHSHSTDSGRKENLKYKLYEIIMKQLINKYSTLVLACGIDAGNYLYGKKMFVKKGIIINNGIDTKKFRYDPETKGKILREFNIDKKLVVGHVGRLAEVKNHIFLLEVFKLINKDEPDSVLLLVGDGELRKAIEDKIEYLGLKKDVIITGLRSDVSDIMQAMDVFVFPSLYEGLPLTTIEAQSSGLVSLISSNVTAEVKVTDLITFMSLENDAVKWASKVLDLSKYQRRDRSEEIKKKGFDICTTIMELETLYEK